MPLRGCPVIALLALSLLQFASAAARWQLEDAPAAPPARANAAGCAYGRSALVVAGGARGGQLLGDAHQYADGAWRRLGGAAAQFPPRADAACARAGLASLLLLGGRCGERVACEDPAWAYDYRTAQWAELQLPEASSAALLRRYAHACATQGDAIYTHGGVLSGPEDASAAESDARSVHILQPINGQWSLRSARGAALVSVARRNHAMVAREGVVFLHGGLDGRGVVSADVLVLDTEAESAAWVVHSPVLAPGQVSVHARAFHVGALYAQKYFTVAGGANALGTAARGVSQFDLERREWAGPLEGSAAGLFALSNANASGAIIEGTKLSAFGGIPEVASAGGGREWADAPAESLLHLDLSGQQEIFRELGVRVVDSEGQPLAVERLMVVDLMGNLWEELVGGVSQAVIDIAADAEATVIAVEGARVVGAATVSVGAAEVTVRVLPVPLAVRTRREDFASCVPFAQVYLTASADAITDGAFEVVEGSIANAEGYAVVHVHSAAVGPYARAYAPRYRVRVTSERGRTLWTGDVDVATGVEAVATTNTIETEQVVAQRSLLSPDRLPVDTTPCELKYFHVLWNRTWAAQSDERKLLLGLRLPQVGMNGSLFVDGTAPFPNEQTAYRWSERCEGRNCSLSIPLTALEGSVRVGARVAASGGVFEWALQDNTPLAGSLRLAVYVLGAEADELPMATRDFEAAYASLVEGMLPGQVQLVKATSWKSEVGEGAIVELVISQPLWADLVDRAAEVSRQAMLPGFGTLYLAGEPFLTAEEVSLDAGSKNVDAIGAYIGGALAACALALAAAYLTYVRLFGGSCRPCSTAQVGDDPGSLPRAATPSSQWVLGDGEEELFEASPSPPASTVGVDTPSYVRVDVDPPTNPVTDGTAAGFSDEDDETRRLRQRLRSLGRAGMVPEDYAVPLAPTPKRSSTPAGTQLMSAAQRAAQRAAQQTQQTPTKQQRAQGYLDSYATCSNEEESATCSSPASAPPPLPNPLAIDTPPPPPLVPNSPGEGGAPQLGAERRVATEGRRPRRLAPMDK